MSVERAQELFRTMIESRDIFPDRLEAIERELSQAGHQEEFALVGVDNEYWIRLWRIAHGNVDKRARSTFRALIGYLRAPLEERRVFTIEGTIHAEYGLREAAHRCQLELPKGLVTE